MSILRPPSKRTLPEISLAHVQTFSMTQPNHVRCLHEARQPARVTRPGPTCVHVFSIFMYVRAIDASPAAFAKMGFDEPLDLTRRCLLIFTNTLQRAFTTAGLLPALPPARRGVRVERGMLQEFMSVYVFGESVKSGSSDGNSSKSKIGSDYIRGRLCNSYQV